MGFYYLKSRYYDPKICRFINADGLASTGQGFLGYNMFAYCNNNPVNSEDDLGNIPYRTHLVMMTDRGSGNRGYYADYLLRKYKADSKLKGENLLSTFESQNEYTITTIKSDVGIVTFDSFVVMHTIVQYSGSIAAILAAAAAAPGTVGGSLVVASMALDVMVGAGVASATNMSLAIEATLKYKMNGSVEIVYYSPSSPDGFWDWLVNSGIKAK